MVLTVSLKLCFSCFSSAYHQQSLNPTTKKFMGPTKFFCKSTNLLSSRRLSGYSPSQASNSPGEEASESSTINESVRVYLQDDVNYLWKLGIGSAVGAALIKYGSILFLEITKPNLLQALIMISTPVIVAVVLLLKQSQE